MRAFVFFAFLALIVGSFSAQAASYPAPHDGTYTISQFRFEDGQTLSNLRLHYVTFGTPKTDANGRTTNAVIVLHGTGGSTTQFVSDRFARFTRLQSRAAAQCNRSAAFFCKLCGRPNQSAGIRHSAARDRQSQTRPFHSHPNRTANPRPRHAHIAGGLGRLLAAVVNRVAVTTAY